MGLATTETERLSPHVVVFPGVIVSHGVPTLLLGRKLCRLGINVSFTSTASIIAKFKVRSVGNSMAGWPPLIDCMRQLKLH